MATYRFLCCLLPILVSLTDAETFISEEEVVSAPVKISGVPLKSDAGNANEYLDQVLKNLESLVKEKRLDPLPLPNVKKGFEKMVGLIKIHGGFQVTQNRLQGLRTLHRTGDATLTFQDNAMRVQASLGIDNMKVSGKAMAWWGAIRKPFGVAGTVEHVSATVVLEMPMADSGKPQATLFQIDKIGKIKLDVQDLGVLNWVINGLGSLVLNMLKGVLKSKLSPPLLKMINGVLEKYPILGS